MGNRHVASQREPLLADQQPPLAQVRRDSRKPRWSGQVRALLRISPFLKNRDCKSTIPYVCMSFHQTDVNLAFPDEKDQLRVVKALSFIVHHNDMFNAHLFVTECVALCEFRIEESTEMLKNLAEQKYQPEDVIEEYSKFQRRKLLALRKKDNVDYLLARDIVEDYMSIRTCLSMECGGDSPSMESLKEHATRCFFEYFLLHQVHKATDVQHARNTSGSVAIAPSSAGAAVNTSDDTRALNEYDNVMLREYRVFIGDWDFENVTKWWRCACCDTRIVRYNVLFMWKVGMKNSDDD